jgi:multidrug resistance efflux pump
MSIKHEYQKKLQAQLNEWSAEIDKLRAKADKAEADVKLDYQKQIANLKSLKNEADKKMAELNNASDEAWQDLKAGTDKAWNSLGKALHSATSRF